MGTQGSSHPPGRTSSNQGVIQASSHPLEHMDSPSPADTLDKVTLARPLLAWTPT